MMKYALAAVAACVAFAPVSAVTLDFSSGSYDLYLSSPTYDFYKSRGYDIAIDGTIANEFVSGSFVQVGIAEINAYQTVQSFDVRGTGQLRLQNFDICCQPIDSYPTVTFELTGDWQTISFTPEMKGFFFQISADNSFDFDNAVLGPPEQAPTAAIPEPATWALMILGFAAVGFRTRGAASRASSRCTSMRRRPQGA